MKVGLFGGSFNPIHIGHLLIIDRAIEELGLDRLIVKPTACNPHKMANSDIAPAEHRLAMARIATAELRNIFPRLEVSDLEIKRGASSYTIDTVKELKKENCEVFLMIGGDSYNSLYLWHKIDELKKLVTFAVARRPGYNTTDFYQKDRPDKIDLDIPNIDISASEIRRRLKDNHSVNFLMPNGVVEYIREHELYLTSK